MSEQIIDEIKDSLTQAEYELSNGAIIAGIVLNAYKKFDFDFNLIDKAINSYQLKVSVLSLSNIIEDKKIRKKYDSLINKYLSDGYSSVRKAAAFSEPLLWYWEKEKNQKKKIERLVKEHKKFNENYIEGVLLGLGVVAKQLEPEAQDELIKFYEVVQENYSDEQILISACFGLSLFGITTQKSELAAPVLFKLIQNPGKKIRSSAAQALAFLTAGVKFETSLEIVNYFIKFPPYQESWPLNLTIIMTYFRHSSEDQKSQLLEVLDKISNKDPELNSIIDILEEDSDPLSFLTSAIMTNYSQVRFAVLFVSYYIERHKEEIKFQEEDLRKFANLCIVLLGDQSGFIRSFSLYRLLSISISLETSEYVENFKSHVNDQLQRNRSISAIAIAYLTVLYNPDKINEIKKQLLALKDPQVRKGMLIGLGMGFNPKIHESETADEQVLGLLEITGEAAYVGFILIISTLL